MKKLVFIMPLMVASLLASCGPKPELTYTVTVKAGENGKFPSGDIEISLNVEPNSNLLKKLSNITKPTYVGTTLYQTFDTFTYADGNPIGKDDEVTFDNITVKGTYRKKTLEECSWKEIDEISKSGKAKDFFGESTPANPKTKTVMVNGQPHKVRIIGFNHDALKSDKTKTAGITFEFANVITNSVGNADTTYWNNKDDDDSTNYKYSESTLNDYLNVGENCIFKKLPDELKADGIIKEVYKPVAEDSSYEINDAYTTKLFPLSYREITASSESGYVKEEGSAYPFYTGDDYDTDDNRIKKKVGASSDKGGEYYWLRSPDTNYNYHAWIVNLNGHLNYGYYVYNGAIAVAPAFCI